MAVVVVTGGMEGRLVERRGDDHGDVAGLGKPHGAFHVTVGGLAAGGRQLAVLEFLLTLGRDVDNRHRTDGRGRQRGFEGEAGLAQRIGALQEPEIADHGAAGPVCRGHLGERLHRDLGTDTGWIPKGDPEHGSARHATPR